MTQANPRNKVCIDRYEAFIPYINHVKNGVTNYACYLADDFNFPLAIVKHLNNNEVLCKTINTGKHMVVDAKKLYVKRIVVLFKDIEDYTHYQTEIKFKDDEHI